MTERGHIEEFDDSKGNERIHRWHNSGTYEEIDVNGTKVTRIVGDSYEILDRDGNVYIRGNCNLTVVGDANIRVENNATMQVLGDMKTEVTGNYSLRVGKNFSLGAKEGIKIKTEGSFMEESLGETSLEG